MRYPTSMPTLLFARGNAQRAPEHGERTLDHRQYVAATLITWGSPSRRSTLELSCICNAVWTCCHDTLTLPMAFSSRTEERRPTDSLQTATVGTDDAGPSCPTDRGTQPAIR